MTTFTCYAVLGAAVDTGLTTPLFYAMAGVAIFCIGLRGVLVRRHLLRKVIGLNFMGGGVFLTLVALAARAPGQPDPVPQAMVLTGLVVTVGATALALALSCRVYQETGATELPEDRLP